MQFVIEKLIVIHQRLEQMNEPIDELINSLINEGKSMSEIEQAVLELTKIQRVYDSVHMALKMLEG